MPSPLHVGSVAEHPPEATNPAETAAVPKTMNRKRHCPSAMKSSLESLDWGIPRLMRTQSNSKGARKALSEPVIRHQGNARVSSRDGATVRDLVRGVEWT